MQIYVHIPFCKRKCSYCDFCSQTLGDEREYIDALIQEIKIQSKKFKDKKVSTLYVGGGTPSVLKEGMLQEIVTALDENFDIKATERTIEANPESLSADKLKEYLECDFDRLSIGVQSFDDNVLRAIGRLHDGKTAFNALESATSVFKNVSCDMMIGLPLQSIKSAVATAKILVNCDIKHISCYSLILEEGTPLHKSVGDGTIKLPSDDECVAMFDEVMKVFEDAGFLRYEVSNFAKLGYESQHNVGYWQREEYLGLGASAHSLIDETRFCNVSDVKSYIEKMNISKSHAIDVNNLSDTFFGYQEVNKLSKDEIAFEKIMLGLRMTRGIPKSSFIRFEKQLEKHSEFFENKSNGNLALTKRGFEVMNTILCDFMK